MPSEDSRQAVSDS